MVDNIKVFNAFIANMILASSTSMETVVDDSLIIIIYRIEFCFKGAIELNEAYEGVRTYEMINSLPKGVKLAKKVDTNDYKELIQFVYMEHRESIDRGRTNEEPSIERKKNLIELLNCLGFL